MHPCANAKGEQMKKPRRAEPGTVARKMRTQAKLSQGDVARALGVNQSVLSKMEKGRAKLPLPALLVIADLCGFEIQAVSRRDRLTLKAPERYQRVGVRVRRSEVRRAA